MSTAEAFWLFRVLSELQPSCVVDSGSATGWSAFVAASAVPEAEIYLFDPYRRPTLMPPNARYTATDWTALSPLPDRYGGVVRSPCQPAAARAPSKARRSNKCSIP